MHSCDLDTESLGRMPSGSSGRFCVHPTACMELIIIGVVLEPLSVYVVSSLPPIAGLKNRGRGWVWAPAPRRGQSALQGRKRDRRHPLRILRANWSPGYFQVLGSHSASPSHSQALQEFKKSNTILASTRLQFAVPLTSGEFHWLCSLLSIDNI